MATELNVSEGFIRTNEATEQHFWDISDICLKLSASLCWLHVNLNVPSETNLSMFVCQLYCLKLKEPKHTFLNVDV